MKIKKATAIYTGGGIYEYIAELEDGNWIYGSDDGLIIVNESPLESYDECADCSWQQERLVKYIDDEDFQVIINEIVCTILNGKILEEHNYDIGELVERMKEVAVNKKYRNVKLSAGLTGEYEIIRTDAPDSAIKAEIVYFNAVTEVGDWKSDIEYPIITALGYNVECLGCHMDFDEEEIIKVDIEFDRYEKY